MSKLEPVNGKTAADVSLPVKMDKNTFVFCLEFERSDNEPTTGETLRQIPANGVRMGFVPINETNMKKAVPETNFVMAELWLGIPETPGNIELTKRYGKPLHVWQDEAVGILREAMKVNGERVWWNITGEQDVGTFGRETMFKSKKEAFTWVRDSFLTNKPGRFPPNNHEKRTNYPLMKNRYKIDFEKENIAIQAGMCFTVHYIYEWGAKFGWIERNCYLANNQIATAFMRGAAKQYDGYWGLDFSPWGTPTRGATQHDDNGVLVGGLSASLQLREWLAAFYSGANLVLAEYSNKCAWMNPAKWKLSPHGECAKQFGRHALLDHPDRGMPHVPVALMLEHNHGWDPREHRLFNGWVEYTRADQMLDNFFNLAFPGQEEGNYGSKWMPDGSPQFPWKDEANLQRALAEPRASRLGGSAAGGAIDEDEAICLRKMMAEGLDTRPYERGMQVNSQWGDSFDVVLENCPLEVLVKYKLIILLGAIQLTGELEKKLRQYVEQGGELVVNTRQISRRNEKFLGIKLTGKITPVCMFYPTWKKIVYNEISGIDLFTVVTKDVEVLEVAGSDPKAPPTLVKRRLGNGAVYFSGVPYMQSADSLPIAGHCADFIDWLISRHLLLKVSTGIQYLVNTKGAEIIVTLINNYEKDWSGEVIPVKSGLKLRRGVDLWNNKPVPASDFKDGVLKTNCPAFGFRILSLQG